MGFRTRLFVLTLGIVLLTLASAYLYLAQQTREDTWERSRADLTLRLQLLQAQLKTMSGPSKNLDFWDEIADDLGDISRSRVTLMAEDGTVVGDSQVSRSGLAAVENHSNRPEVQIALRGELGVSSRRSATVQREILYVAGPWLSPEGSLGAVRVGLPLREVELARASAVRHLSFAGLLGLVVAFLGSSLMAHLISGDVRKLTLVARKIAGGDLQARSLVKGHDEFATLAATLNSLAGNLESTLAELRSERDRLNRVVGSMHEGLLLIDQSGRIQLVNTRAQEMLLLGKHAIGEDVESMLGDVELVRLLHKALQGENSSQELQLGAPSTHRVLTNVRRLHQRTGALAVLVDITERRRLELVRQEFVANASHELRTPVTAILSAVETLQGVAPEDVETARRFIEMIARNAERLRALVGDLLELSTLESGQLKVECTTISLRHAVDSVLSSLSPSARTKQLDLICLVPTACEVSANPRGLEHVLVNLVQNAVNYCPAHSKVTISCKQLNGSVETCVADNGPGIANEHLERLFERFYRVDTGRSRGVGGTGLGLSIVRHWVEAMGGSVRVTSEIGAGSTFYVTLRSPEPRSTDAADAHSAK